MNNILLVEGDCEIAAFLQAELNSFSKLYQFTIVENCKSAILKLQQFDYDLVITELSFKNCKMDGIDLAHQVNYYWQTPVVFLITSREKDDDTILQRIKVASHLCIIDRSIRENVFNEIKSILKKIPQQKDIVNKNSVLIRSIGGLSKLIKQEIVFVLAAGSRCTIFYKNNKQIIHTVSMKAFVDTLDCELFVKTHRSYTVNIAHIESVMGNEINLIYNESTWKIPLSNMYKENLIFNWAKY